MCLLVQMASSPKTLAIAAMYLSPRVVLKSCRPDPVSLMTESTAVFWLPAPAPIPILTFYPEVFHLAILNKLQGGFLLLNRPAWAMTPIGLLLSLPGGGGGLCIIGGGGIPAVGGAVSAAGVETIRLGGLWTARTVATGVVKTGAVVAAGVVTGTVTFICESVGLAKAKIAISTIIFIVTAPFELFCL